jgi:hypothetical protein
MYLMPNEKKWIRQFMLGTFTCLLVVVVSTSILSQFAAARSIFPGESSTEMQVGSAGMLDMNLRAARSALVAQGMMNDSMMYYVAVLSQQNVVPGDPMTSARGAVGAVLVGDRLMVRGNFRDLSSPMRDYGMDPLNPPNPNITSAFHIHQGEPTENGPFQYALDVMMDDTGRGGSAMGEYTLTPEQQQALADGRLYVDIHTTMNRGGELRGILMPY